MHKNDRATVDRRVHDPVVGLVEAVSLTLATTEILKFSFGRLRPDFQQRVQGYYCYQSDHHGVPCTGFSGSAVNESDLLKDGRVSFPSGHSSISVSLPTYAS